MDFTREAWERAMKVQEIFLQAMSGAISWLQAAEIIGVTPRSMRRWRNRYESYGYDGLLDRRRRKPSSRAAPFQEVQRILRLYRERYGGFNGRHFHQIACREHGVTLSYSYVKKALQAAGLLPKKRARGPHRRRPASLVVFGPGAVLGADHGARRCDEAPAVCTVFRHRVESCGDDGPSGCHLEVRPADGVVHGSRDMGGRYTPGGTRADAKASDPAGPSSEDTGNRTHPLVLTAGSWTDGASESDAAGPARQRD